MEPGQQASIINSLAPQLRAAGLPAKILGYDHNWDVTDFAEQVNNQAGDNVAGSAWHRYGGDPSPQSEVYGDQHKDIFFTECSGHDSDNVANTFADTLRRQGMNLTIGATRNFARTVALWNMALDGNHGPVIGSCGNCNGVATVSGGNITYNAEYYVLGHLSKFVQPGAVRIDSTGYGEGGVENVAFRNPDGTIVLVALNTGGTQNFQVFFGGQSFGYQLPGGSMATFTWPGSGGGTTTPPHTGPISGLGGRCLDVTGGSTANGNRRSCGTARRARTSSGRSRVTAPSAAWASASTSPATPPPTAPRSSSGTASAHQPEVVGRRERLAGQRGQRQVPGRRGRLDGQRHQAADLDLLRRPRPALVGAGVTVHTGRQPFPTPVTGLLRSRAFCRAHRGDVRHPSPVQPRGPPMAFVE